MQVDTKRDHMYAGGSWNLMRVDMKCGHMYAGVFMESYAGRYEMWSYVCRWFMESYAGRYEMWSHLCRWFMESYAGRYEMRLKCFLILALAIDFFFYLMFKPKQEMLSLLHGRISMDSEDRFLSSSLALSSMSSSCSFSVLMDCRAMKKGSWGGGGKGLLFLGLRCLL